MPGVWRWENDYSATAACHGILSGYTCGGVGEPCDGGSRLYFRQNSPATRGHRSALKSVRFVFVPVIWLV